jgi:hypothetical protein
VQEGDAVGLGRRLDAHVLPHRRRRRAVWWTRPGAHWATAPTEWEPWRVEEVRRARRDGTGHRGGDERTCFCCCVAPRLTTSTSHGAQERQGARPVKASTVQSEQSQVRGRDRDCTGGTCIVYCIPYKLSRQAKNYLRSGVSPTPTRKATSAWRLFKIAVVFFKNM